MKTYEAQAELLSLKMSMLKATTFNLKDNKEYSNRHKTFGLLTCASWLLELAIDELEKTKEKE